MKKFLAFLKEKKRLVTGAMMVGVMTVLGAVSASAETVTPTPVTVDDFTSVLTSLQNQISVSTVVAVLVVLVGACAGLAFMWWGVRKLVRALMSAFKKGKISL